MLQQFYVCVYTHENWSRVLNRYLLFSSLFLFFSAEDQAQDLTPGLDLALCHWTKSPTSKYTTRLLCSMCAWYWGLNQGTLPQLHPQYTCLFCFVRHGVSLSCPRLALNFQFCASAYQMARIIGTQHSAQLLHRYLHIHIHNSQRVKATQMSIKGWMNDKM